jgi:hypothetical protein
MFARGPTVEAIRRVTDRRSAEQTPTDIVHSPEDIANDDHGGGGDALVVPVQGSNPPSSPP